MNDKCASGTGATIEKCTMKVGMESQEVQKLSFQTDKLHHVAAKCGVFAETDIVNLVKTSVPSDEIVITSYSIHYTKLYDTERMEFL